MYISIIELLKEKMKRIRQILMSDNYSDVVSALAACDSVRDEVVDLWNKPGISKEERQELIKIDTEALHSWQCFGTADF